MPHKDPDAKRAYDREYYRKNASYGRQYAKEYRKKNPKSVLISGALHRSKKSGVEFSITQDDIVIPEFCPVLNVRLENSLGSRGPGPNSPSLDRIDPRKGYIPGNVAVISHAANRMKAELTAEEHRMIADWMDEQT